jgi:hypothetical protein
LHSFRNYSRLSSLSDSSCGCSALRTIMLLLIFNFYDTLHSFCGFSCKLLSLLILNGILSTKSLC